MAEVDDLRRATKRISDRAAVDLRRIVLELTDMADRGLALHDILPGLIDAYGDAAAAVAAEWYEDIREQHVTGGRRFTATPAAAPRDAGAHELAAWAQSKADNADTMLQLAIGGMQRRIADQARLTVIGSALYDPRADGWMRIGDGDNCKFCDMLISRGAVYTEATVRFGAHDWCNCGAAPSFGRPSDIFDVDEYRRSSRRWNADGTRTDPSIEDDARAVAWIEENLGDAAVVTGARRVTTGRAPAQSPASGFDGLSIKQLEHQLDVLASMPDTDYKRQQVARIRARLAELRS